MGPEKGSALQSDLADQCWLDAPGWPSCWVNMDRTWKGGRQGLEASVCPPSSWWAECLASAYPGERQVLGGVLGYLVEA